eukprot:g62069.t1
MSKEAKDFPELKNDLILRAARGEQTERVPVWLHRQAGRYLPEFREVRKKADFFTLCRTPELACEVTIQPLKRFPLDAAIIFSDILVIPQALGMEVQMLPEKGPVLPKPLRDPSHLDRVKKPDVSVELKYVADAITLTRHELKGQVPLIGFSGAPWTLMCYMVEGGGAKSYDKARAWLYKTPKEARKLLHLISDTVVDYLVMQVEAGAQMLEVFDSWAGDLTPALFKEFSLPCLIDIVTRVKATLKKKGITPVPMTCFAKGANWALEDLAASPYDVLSLDWTIDPASARQRVNGKVALQGNLDPGVLFADEETIKKEAAKMLNSFGSPRGYIANLGHGMLPDHTPGAVATLVKAVHEHDFGAVSEPKSKKAKLHARH